MNAQMISELHQAALALSRDQAVRAVVIGSDGPIFCAGADLTWMQEQQQKDKVGRIAEARTLSDMLTAINSMPKTCDYSCSRKQLWWRSGPDQCSRYHAERRQRKILFF